MIQRPSAKTLTLSAPVGGWNVRDGIATMPPLDAVIMENWWPNTSDVQLRFGWTRWAYGMPSPVQTIFAYSNPTTNKQFAASGSAIYDTTAGGAVGAAAVTGLSSSYWQYINVATAGGNYLMAVNGLDTPLLYDGTTWGTTAITGVTQSNLVHINLFKNRVWLIEKNTLKAWYLGTNAIAGAASQFNLQSIAKKGGYLMAMGTWTIDAGEGVDDYAVFVTSNGEVIVYNGTDPASADTWALKGIWEMGSPLGRRCFIKFGGDMLLACFDGVQPLSRALQSSRVDPRVTMTNKIQGAMSEVAGLYGNNQGWQLDFCPKDSRLLLNVPQDSGTVQFAMNTITGSWAKFSGVASYSWAQYLNDSYFGGDGYVGKFWDGVIDYNTPITGTVLQAFNTFGNAGQTKRWTMAQLIFSASGPPSISANVNVDYDATVAYAPVDFSNTVYGEWDSGIWDQSIWGGGTAAFKPYVGLTGIGKAAGMRLQTTSNQLEIRWQATNYTFETGGFL